MSIGKGRCQSYTDMKAILNKEDCENIVTTRFGLDVASITEWNSGKDW